MVSCFGPHYFLKDTFLAQEQYSGLRGYEKKTHYIETAQRPKNVMAFDPLQTNPSSTGLSYISSSNACVHIFSSSKGQSSPNCRGLSSIATLKSSKDIGQQGLCPCMTSRGLLLCCIW